MNKSNTEGNSLTSKERFKRWKQTKCYHWKQKEYIKMKLYDSLYFMTGLAKVLLFLASALTFLSVAGAYGQWFQDQLKQFGVTNQDFLYLAEHLLPALFLCAVALLIFVAVVSFSDPALNGSSLRFLLNVYYWPGAVLFLAFSWLIQSDFPFAEPVKMLLNSWLAGAFTYCLLKLAFISMRKHLGQDVFKKLNQDFYFKAYSQKEWQQASPSLFMVENRWKPYIRTVRIEKKQAESKMLDFFNAKQYQFFNQGENLSSWKLTIKVELNQDMPMDLYWKVKGFENRDHQIIFLKEKTRSQVLKNWMNHSYRKKEWQRMKYQNKDVTGQEFLELNSHRARNIKALKQELIQSNLYDKYGRFYLCNDGYSFSAHIKADSIP